MSTSRPLSEVPVRPDRGQTVFPGAEELPDGQEKVAFVRTMFDRISPRYDLVNRIMTFGLDSRWRRLAVRRLGLHRASVVVDIACGTGDFCRDLVRSGIQPIGVDLSWGMLSHAPAFTSPSRSASAASSRSHSVGNTTPFAQCDASQLPFKESSADGVTCGFALRNFADLRAVLREMGRITRPGGRIALLEVSTPTNPVLAWGHRIHFRKLVPMIGALLSDGPAYRYLPRSVAYLPESSVMSQWIRDAGFDGIASRPLTGGVAQLITATRISP